MNQDQMNVDRTSILRNKMNGECKTHRKPSTISNDSPIICSSVERQNLVSTRKIQSFDFNCGIYYIWRYM